MSGNATVLAQGSGSLSVPRSGWGLGLLSPWSLGLWYTLLVILFGAIVRITGSGAGCGQHWPSCHGEIAHLPASTETAIELFHRVTSGLDALLAVALWLWTLKRRGKGTLARRAAGWTVVFMVGEALVGALLVLVGLVGNNDSAWRAAVMAVHLVNTSLLTLAMLLAGWSFERPSMRRLPREAGFAVGAWGALAIVVVSGAGAVTALGDTLFPVQGGAGEVAGAALDEGGHFLERLRGFHPVLAVSASLGLLWARESLVPSPARAAFLVFLLAQIAAGIANIWLSAPGWMQVVHLALANLLWLAWWLAVFQSLELAGAKSRSSPESSAGDISS